MSFYIFHISYFSNVLNRKVLTRKVKKVKMKMMKVKGIQIQNNPIFMFVSCNHNFYNFYDFDIQISFPFPFLFYIFFCYLVIHLFLFLRFFRSFLCILGHQAFSQKEKEKKKFSYSSASQETMDLVNSRLFVFCIFMMSVMCDSFVCVCWMKDIWLSICLFICLFIC